MRFGKTDAQLKVLEDRRKAKLAARREWHKRFAWFPVRIIGGPYVWLEFVEARESSELVGSGNWQEREWVWQYRPWDSRG